MTVSLPLRSGWTRQQGPALLRSTLFAGVLLIAATAIARAQVTVTLTPSTMTGTAGSTTTYSATIQNFSSAATYYLQGVSFSIDPSSSSYISGNDNPFFNNVPLSLAPGASYSGQYFGIDVSSLAPSGSYTGTVSLLGNTDNSSNYTTLGTPQSFILNLASSTTPEPGSAVLAGPGLMAFASAAAIRGTRRRRRNGQVAAGAA